MSQYMEGMHPYIRSGNRAVRLTDGGPFRSPGGVVPAGLGSEAASSMETRVMRANSDYNIDQARPASYVKDQFADFHNFVHETYGPVKIKPSRFSANTTTIVTGSAPKFLQSSDGQHTVMNTDAIRGMILDRGHVTTRVTPEGRTPADRLREATRMDREIYENLQRASDAKMDAVRAHHIASKVKGRHARAALNRANVGCVQRGSIGGIGATTEAPFKGDTNTLLLGLGIAAAAGAALWMMSR